jgi:CRP-like cAMP-binding protein
MNSGPTVTQNPETDSLLASLLPAREQQHHLTRLPAGTIIHRYGSTCRGIFFVKEGTIEISWPVDNGHEPIRFEIGPGGAVGLTAAIGGGDHEFTATVKQPVSGYFIAADELRRWLVKDPANYLPLAKLLSDWNERIFSILRKGRQTKQRRARAK